MDNYVAIRYEKIELTSDMFIFKPVSVIQGKFNGEDMTFETNYGDVCFAINSCYLDEESYFGSPVPLEALCPENSDTDINEALFAFYMSRRDNYTLGLYNPDTGLIDILNISMSDVYEAFNSSEKGEIDMDISNRPLVDDNGFVEELSDEEPFEKVDQILNANKQKKSKEQPNKLSLDKEKSKRITLSELRKEVKDVIKGEDKAVEDVTRAIIINQNSLNPKHKSHILITGPSGTGKTEIMNIISKRLDLPCFKADATAYTKEGYVGKSIPSMLKGLLNAANGDLEKAEHGILIVDEIDKKLSTDKSEKVSGVDVLYSMLKMMDRDIIELEISNGIQEKQLLFDTSNLTIVFMGAFADIYKQKEEEKKQKEEESKKKIGFFLDNTDEKANKKTKTQKKKSRIIEESETKKEDKIILTNDDLIKAGMPAEFLGRIPVITSTEELSIENLVEILYKSKGGTIEEEKEFCKGLGITLKFTDGYIKEIARQAKATKTGARNLRKLVRESIAPAYDEILLGKDVKVLKLTKQTAINNKKYYME